MRTAADSASEGVTVDSILNAIRPQASPETGDWAMSSNQSSPGKERPEVVESGGVDESDKGDDRSRWRRRSLLNMGALARSV